ncbi:MAG: DDE-type integrase/transposase/recombinase [Leptolyngbya sp. BL-A-14]
MGANVPLNLVESYSLQELVDLALPGYPSTISGWNRLAKRIGLKYTSRSGRGGGRLFLFSSLPEEVQLALIEQQKIKAAQQLVPPARIEAPEHIAPISLSIDSGVPYGLLKSVSEKEQVRMDTRLAILQEFHNFHWQNPSQQLEAEVRFSQIYNARQILIQVPGGYSSHDIYPTVSRKQISTWRSLQRSQGTARLKGNYGPRRGKGKIDLNNEIQNFIVTAIGRFPHIKATHLKKALDHRYGDAVNFKLRTLQGWMKNWKEKHRELFAAFVSPNYWKSKFMVSFGSYSDGLKRNDRVEVDDSSLDLILEDGFRYKLLVAVEVFSRARKLELRETNNFEAVAALLCSCITVWGKMRLLVSDRGPPFVSNEIKRFCADIGIKHHICEPNSPWEKPYAESAIRVVLHGILEICPEYIGHSVRERQEIEARLRGFDRQPLKEIEIRRSREQMQALLDSINVLYMQSPQAALEGKTPTQMLQETQGEAVYVADDRALDVLRTRVPGQDSTRIVQKKGIQVGKDWFIEDKLHKYVGKPVYIRIYSPIELCVLDADLNRICIAKKATDPSTNRPKIARSARKKQVDQLQLQLNTYNRLAESLNLENISQEIVDWDLRKIQQGLLEGGHKTYESPMMKAITELLDAQTPEEIGEALSPEELEAARVLLDAIENEQFSIQPEISDAFKKLRQVVSLWQRGTLISDISQQDFEQVQTLLDSSCGEPYLLATVDSPDEAQKFISWINDTHECEVQQPQTYDRAKLLDKVFYQWNRADDVDKNEKQDVLEYLSLRNGQGRLLGLEPDWQKRQDFEDWLAETRDEEVHQVADETIAASNMN